MFIINLLQSLNYADLSKEKDESQKNKLKCFLGKIFFINSHGI